MVDEDWFREAERLVTDIDRLTYERDTLLSALLALELDHEEALARIEELEALNSALQRELFGTKGKPRKKTVGHIAAALVFVAGGALGGFVQGPGVEVYQHLRGVAGRSAAVAAACDVHVDITIHVLDSDEARVTEAADVTIAAPSGQASATGAGQGAGAPEPLSATIRAAGDVAGGNDAARGSFPPRIEPDGAEARDNLSR